MNLFTINTGHFKLDGGAMFGVVPKSIWHKLNPADDNNMCSWALRCLLIENGKQLILIDNGMGNKQDQKFFSHYYLHGDDTLEKSLNHYGFTANDITDMVLTHLHFDHCGGSIQYNADHSKLEPAFKNATYHIHQKQWDWALNPNPREKASFLKENIVPIQESGQLKMLDTTKQFADSMSFKEVYGHTEAMVLPFIEFKGRKILYMADLLPSAAHVPLPYVMAYDVRPLETMKEKTKILQEAADQNWVLYLEHDPSIECITVENTEKGIRVKEKFKLSEL